MAILWLFAVPVFLDAIAAFTSAAFPFTYSFPNDG